MLQTHQRAQPLQSHGFIAAFTADLKEPDASGERQAVPADAGAEGVANRAVRVTERRPALGRAGRTVRRQDSVLDFGIPDLSCSQ